MTSPLALDQLAAQHRSDLLAEFRRPLPGTTTTDVLAPHARRLVLAFRSAFAAAATAPTARSSSRPGQVCCA